MTSLLPSLSRRHALFLLTSLASLSFTPSQLHAEKTSPKPQRLFGNPESSVLVEEYFSATCPHCRAFHLEDFPTIKKEYIDTGRIAWQYRDFPLDKESLLVAQIARYANGSAYEKVINFFLRQQKLWAGRGKNAITKIAVQAGFTEAQVKEALEDESLQNDVIAELLKGKNSYGVQGTPSFVINGELQKGGHSVTNLKLILGRALKA
jgi:protein-disulfide isomerase